MKSNLLICLIFQASFAYSSEIIFVRTTHNDNYNAPTATEERETAKSKLLVNAILNQLGRPDDIVLYEGSPFKRLELRNAIPANGDTQALSHSFYMAGWEQPVELAAAHVLQLILGHLVGDQNDIQYLKAKYLFLKAAMIDRNQALLATLTKVEHEASTDKRIFVLAGAAHFTDPEFMDATQSLPRPTKFYDAQTTSNAGGWQALNATWMALLQRGVNLVPLMKTYEEFKAAEKSKIKPGPAEVEKLTQALMGRPVSYCELLFSETGLKKPN